MKIFILTGAGISAESGLGTFRDKGGLWEKFDPMKLATPEAFAADPVKVHEFYNMRRRDMLGARPNEAHAALARLEAHMAANGGSLFLCTQNIDDLHEQAGSKAVHHMHGGLLQSLCGHCGDSRPCRDDLSTTLACAACGKTGGMRPNVVWFGEMPYGMDRIDDELTASDLFISIGTSGSVYPAAGFVQTARACGIETCEINLEPSDNAFMFSRCIYGPAGQAVPEFVDSLIAAA